MKQYLWRYKSNLDNQNTRWAKILQTFLLSCRKFNEQNSREKQTFDPNA